jgi:hypothetical protein
MSGVVVTGAASGIGRASGEVRQPVDTGATPASGVGAFGRDVQVAACVIQPGVHVARRGTRGEAAALVRGIIANHDDRAHTAHDIAADTRASITGWISNHRGITEKCGGPLGQGTADDCW